LTGDSATFGTLLALSRDTALIGAPAETLDTSDQSPGVAYVFVRQGRSWVRQAKLIPSAGQPEWYFGYGLAIDGDTALLGSKLDPSGERRGTQVFTRTGQQWAWQATLLDDSFNSQNLIDPLALDGNTAVVGVYAGDSEPGAAYVFVRSGSEWTQQAKLTAPNSHAGDWFGYTVGISGDTVLVGAADAGAYVFERSQGAWALQTTLEVPEPHVSDFQLAFAGNTAVIGAPVENVDGNENQGAVYVFERSGSAWSRSRLTACDGAAQDLFGAWLAVSGNRLAAVSWRPFEFTGVGIVHVFQRSAGTWSQIARLDPSASVQPTYGFPVALSRNNLLLADEGLVHAYARR
jgi:hypothetical protein